MFVGRQKSARSAFCMRSSLQHAILHSTWGRHLHFTVSYSIEWGHLSTVVFSDRTSISVDCMIHWSLMQFTYPILSTRQCNKPILAQVKRVQHGNYVFLKREKIYWINQRIILWMKVCYSVTSETGLDLIQSVQLFAEWWMYLMSSHRRDNLISEATDTHFISQNEHCCWGEQQGSDLDFYSVLGQEKTENKGGISRLQALLPPLAFLFSKICKSWTNQEPSHPHEGRQSELERIRAKEKREAAPFLSHSFDSQFTRRSQPGGRDFEEERSVARLNLKCQMLYFDLMEKIQFRGFDRPHATKHFSPHTQKKKKISEATNTDSLFHRAVVKQRGASALKASDTWSSNCHQLEH